MAPRSVPSPSKPFRRYANASTSKTPESVSYVPFSPHFALRHPAQHENGSLLYALCCSPIISSIVWHSHSFGSISGQGTSINSKVMSSFSS